jgi:hypothetical protein
MPPPRPIWQLILGLLVGNAVGGILLYVVTLFSGEFKQASSALVWPSFILIPFIVGLVAAWFWRRLNRSIAISFLDALWTLLVSLAAAAIVLREGVVCLVIVSPLVYVLQFAGILVGRVWFRPNYSKLQLTIFPLLALLTVGESLYHSEQQAVVTDSIVIHAPPAKVWPHVLAFPEIPDAPGYWIFRLGLPYPTQTTNGGNFVGADRQCMFSNGIVIKERVAEFVANEKLTFDIAEQPTDPEAYGHISLHRGQFVLRDNHDGTTTLIGSSWYTLHVRPHWYFDLWTRDMTRAVHLRVMNHIKRMSEESP